MEYLTAVNDKQLGICLRMLYAEGIQCGVETVMNSKRRIEYHISIFSSETISDELRKRYEILIS